MDIYRVPGGNELLDPQYVLKDALGLPYGSSVADLGCGSMAFFTLQAAKLVGDKGRVYALDILKDVLSSVESKAKQNGLLNIKTVWTDLEQVGAAKIEPVDYTFLVNTLFQTKDHEAVMKEAYRLTKPGGILLVVDWKASTGPIGPRQDLRISTDTIESLAKEVGMFKVKEFDAGKSHYGLIFKRS